VSTTKLVSFWLMCLGLSSCVLVQSPSSNLVDEKPVVTMGSTSNDFDDHIVFIPANRNIPVEFSIKGDIFNESASSTVTVSFKEDLYLYKYWASVDGKTWLRSHKLLDVRPSGGFDASGGKVELKLNLAN